MCCGSGYDETTDSVLPSSFLSALPHSWFVLSFVQSSFFMKGDFGGFIGCLSDDQGVGAIRSSRHPRHPFFFLPAGKPRLSRDGAHSALGLDLSKYRAQNKSFCQNIANQDPGTTGKQEL